MKWLGILLLFFSTQSVLSKAKVKNYKVALTWDELQSLEYNQRYKYLNELSSALLPMDTNRSVSLNKIQELYEMFITVAEARDDGGTLGVCPSSGFICDTRVENGVCPSIKINGTSQVLTQSEQCTRLPTTQKIGRCMAGARATQYACRLDSTEPGCQASEACRPIPPGYEYNSSVTGVTDRNSIRPFTSTPVIRPAAERITAANLRKRGNPCIYAGNVSEYESDQAGSCKRPKNKDVEFCGTKFSCPGSEIPCNPLIFGFKGDNKLETVANRTTVLKDGVLEVTIGTLKIQPYKEPYCIGRTANATLACHKKAMGMERSSDAEALAAPADKYKKVGLMMHDLKKSCGGRDGELKKVWDDFADKVNRLCADSDASAFAIINKSKECDVLQKRAQYIRDTYKPEASTKSLKEDSFKEVKTRN